MNTNYIYLLQEREFIKTKENIYKIGMTRQNNLVRFNQYPNGSILLLQTICNDCKKTESQIIKIFKKKFKQRKDIGNEYFEGNYKEMKKIINNIIEEEEEEPKQEYENLIDNQQINNISSEYITDNSSLNLDGSPLENIVKVIYCSDNYNQFKNILVMDIDSENIYKYDDDVGIFVLSDRKETFNKLIDNLLQILEKIYDDEIDNISDNTKTYITNFIKKIKFDNEIYIDKDGKQYDNYKQYEIYKIEKLLFDNRNNIIKNIYNYIK